MPTSSWRLRAALPVAALAALALVPAAQAQERAVSAPSEAGAFSYEINDEEQVAAGFVARWGGALDRIVLPMNVRSAAAAPLTLTLRRDDPDGEVLGTTSIPASEVAVGGTAWKGETVTARFPGVRLQRDRGYVVRAETTSSPDYNWHNAATDDPDVVLWHRWIEDGPDWGPATTNDDLGLEVFVHPDGAPAIDIAAPADGARIPHRAVVAADFTCADPETGVADCTGTVAKGDPIDTSSLGTKTFTVNARNGDGASSTKTVAYEVIDVTAPQITVTAPERDAAYTRGEPQAAGFACVDEAGGSGEDTCVGTVDDGSPFDTGTLGAKTFTVTARDKAGNERTVEVPYTVVDRTPPTIAPESGQRFLIDSAGDLRPVCADEALGSGLESCVVTGAVDTSVVGFHTATVRAEDHAGNVTEAPVRYQVVWPWTGFFAPLNGGGTLNLVKAGSAVPVKFALGGDRGMAVLDGTPTSRSIPCAGDAPVDALEETAASQSGLSYDAASQRYQWVWKTSRDWSGCRRLSVKLADGTVHTVDFRLK